MAVTAECFIQWDRRVKSHSTHLIISVWRDLKTPPTCLLKPNELNMQTQDVGHPPHLADKSGESTAEAGPSHPKKKSPPLTLLFYIRRARQRRGTSRAPPLMWTHSLRMRPCRSASLETSVGPCFSSLFALFAGSEQWPHVLPVY